MFLTFARLVQEINVQSHWQQPKRQWQQPKSLCHKGRNHVPGEKDILKQKLIIRTVDLFPLSRGQQIRHVSSLIKTCFLVWIVLLFFISVSFIAGYAIWDSHCWRPYGDTKLLMSVSFGLLWRVASLTIIPHLLFFYIGCNFNHLSYHYIKYQKWI